MCASTSSEDSPGVPIDDDILALNYHVDIQLVHKPKIYRGTETDSNEMESRRVIFYNLPPTINVLQIARAAAAFGQVLFVNRVAVAVAGTEDGSTAILVEFASFNSAAVCRLAFNSTGPCFVSDSGEQFVAGVWVLPTPSFPVCYDTSVSLDKGYTRSITISPIPVDYVWFIICTVAAPQDLLDAEYDGRTRTLAFEFTSVDNAHRSAIQLNSGVFSFVLGESFEAFSLGICPDRVAYCAHLTFLPLDYLKQQFDRPPFNEYWPDTYYYVMAQRDLHPRTNHKKHNISSSEAATTDEDSNETLSSADTSLDEEPRGRSHLPRDELNFKKQKLEMKELLLSIEDPEMSGSWDDFYQNRQTISLRGWTEYGKIARHRRELSIEQGLAAGMIPKCEGNCELECKDIKEVPRPGEVDKYLSTPQEDILIDF